MALFLKHSLLALPPDVGLASAAALPPDVRRGSASLEGWREKNGLCPWCGLCPHWAKGPNQGLSPSCSNDADGEAEPRRTSGGRAAVKEAFGGRAAASLE